MTKLTAPTPSYFGPPTSAHRVAHPVYGSAESDSASTTAPPAPPVLAVAAATLVTTFHGLTHEERFPSVAAATVAAEHALKVFPGCKVSIVEHWAGLVS